MAATVSIPAVCRAGHELLPCTTSVTPTYWGSTINGFWWECVRCVRASCWRAHYGTEPPASVMQDGRYRRPRAFDGGKYAARMPAWTSRVTFASGWGYADPDPTPALREKRRRADEEKRLLARQQEEAAELRVRRDAKRFEAEESTREIRELMGVSA